MTLYRDILKNAWSITWRNKFLWFFGVFASLLSGTGGLQILTKDPSPSVSENFLPGMGQFSSFFQVQTLKNFGTLFRDDPVFVSVSLLFLLVIFALLIFLVWLSVVSQAALVNDSAELANSKKKNEKLGIHKGVATGVKHFWSVLGMNILTKVIIGLAFVLVGIPVAYMAYKSNFVTLNLIFVILFIVFIPLAIAASFVLKYAICYIVVKKETFGEAMKKGYLLFKDNWLVSMEMAFILVFISFFGFLFFMVTLSVTSLPLIFLALVFYQMLSYLGFWFILSIILLAMFVLIVIGGAILTVFQISSWTLLFLELDKKNTTSKILRIFQ